MERLHWDNLAFVQIQSFSLIIFVFLFLQLLSWGKIFYHSISSTLISNPIKKSNVSPKQFLECISATAYQYSEHISDGKMKMLKLWL